MTIDEEVAVRSVFILADSTLTDGRVFQFRNPSREIATDFGESFFAGDTVTCIRVKRFAVSIDCDLDSAAVDIRQSVSFLFEVDPNRQGRCFKVSSGGYAEVKNFLTRRMN